jgi:hypothetical protein
MELVQTQPRDDTLTATSSPRRLRSAPWADKAFEWLTRSFAFLVFSILLAILLRWCSAAS